MNKDENIRNIKNEWSDKGKHWVFLWILIEVGKKVYSGSNPCVLT